MSNDDCNREDYRLYRHGNLDDDPGVRQGSGTSGASRTNEGGDGRRQAGTIQQEQSAIPSPQTVVAAEGMEERQKREEDKERQTNFEAMRKAEETREVGRGVAGEVREVLASENFASLLRVERDKMWKDAGEAIHAAARK